MFRFRTTATVSLLVLAGATGASLWMSAWPRMQDRPTEAAVAAREHATVNVAGLARTKARVPRASAHVPSKPAHAAPAPPAPPAPVYTPSPTYPIAALRRQRGGVVTLRVRVDGSGEVTAVDIAKSSGDAALDAAARKAMHRWRFQPPAAGQPMSFDYPIAFRIDDSPPP
jgi:protein TonB